HLRPDLVLLVGGEQRVVDHVAVVAAHVRGGPDRIEDRQVRVRHDAQHFVLSTYVAKNQTKCDQGDELSDHWFNLRAGSGEYRPWRESRSAVFSTRPTPSRPPGPTTPRSSTAAAGRAPSSVRRCSRPAPPR